VLAVATAFVSAHDLFLHPRGFFIGPDAAITLPVFNGTFTRSGNAVERARLIDLSLHGPGGRRAIDRATWTEQDPRSTVQVRVGGPGTYVVGAALGARSIALTGVEFDAYLAEEGIEPILAERRRTGRLRSDARESYAKAAKTILAVTDAGGHVVSPAGAASAATQALGYAAELVPLADPYAVRMGGTLPIRALVDGKPLAGWIVLAGGTVGTSTTPIPAQRLTTDADGRVSVRLTHDGHWFVKFVHMRAAPPGTGVDYASTWATLTFGVLP
jgi:hypothetical protein